MRILALILALAAPAGADLIFVGPIKPANRQAYQRLYDRAPERVKRTDVRLEETTKGLRGHRALYQWAAGRRTVLIRPDLKPGEREHILAHEMGHHAHSWCLTGEEFAVWERWWAANKSRLPKDEDQPRYGATSPMEGFAVSFEFWLRRKPLHPQINAMFEEWFR